MFGFASTACSSSTCSSSTEGRGGVRRERDGAADRRVVEGRLLGIVGALPLPEMAVPKERLLFDSFVFLRGA